MISAVREDVQEHLPAALDTYARRIAQECWSARREPPRRPAATVRARSHRSVVRWHGPTPRDGAPQALVYQHVLALCSAAQQCERLTTAASVVERHREAGRSVA